MLFFTSTKSFIFAELKHQQKLSSWEGIKNSVHRRRYKRNGTDEHFSNDCDFTLKGVKMVSELGIFLKEKIEDYPVNLATAARMWDILPGRFITGSGITSAIIFLIVLRASGLPKI